MRHGCASPGRRQRRMRVVVPRGLGVEMLRHSRRPTTAPRVCVDNGGRKQGNGRCLSGLEDKNIARGVCPRRRTVTTRRVCVSKYEDENNLSVCIWDKGTKTTRRDVCFLIGGRKRMAARIVATARLQADLRHRQDRACSHRCLGDQWSVGPEAITGHLRRRREHTLS
jgi:hypothetical protein